jgi:hypothetical protein
LATSSIGDIIFHMSDITTRQRAVRTLISLSPRDKRWLDRQARTAKVPMTEVVRQAIHDYRDTVERRPGSIDGLLRETAGLWHAGDGLRYQRRVRNEWKRSR